MQISHWKSLIKNKWKIFELSERFLIAFLDESCIWPLELCVALGNSFQLIDFVTKSSNLDIAGAFR